LSGSCLTWTTPAFCVSGQIWSCFREGVYPVNIRNKDIYYVAASGQLIM